MYYEDMFELFKKAPVALTESVDYIYKRQLLLIDIGGKWFMEKLQSPPPPNYKAKTDQGSKE